MFRKGNSGSPYSQVSLDEFSDDESSNHETEDDFVQQGVRTQKASI